MPAWCPQILLKSYLCIQFWLCRVFTAAWLSCSCGEWRLLWLWCVGSSWRWPLLLWSVGLGVWAQWSQLSGSRAHAQRLWRTSFVALWHEGSSWTRDWTCVFCIGKPILSHWATREAPTFTFKNISTTFVIIIGTNTLPLHISTQEVAFSCHCLYCDKITFAVCLLGSFDFPF